MVELDKYTTPAISNSSRSSKPLLVPPGKEGLSAAVREGAIRIAKQSDIDRWKRLADDKTRISNYLRALDKYVVLRPVVFSGGMNGANSVVFVVNDHRYMPGGNIGSSIILFTETGACKGLLCGM